MYRVSPYQLWIGHAGDGRDIRLLIDTGIRAIVQLAYEEPPLQPPREIILLRFPLVDDEGNDADLVELAICSVAKLIERDISTLLCCGGGMSRSPVIAAAALAIAGRGTLDDCLKRVTSSHPADVSPGLWTEICRMVARNPDGRGTNKP